MKPPKDLKRLIPMTDYVLNQEREYAIHDKTVAQIVIDEEAKYAKCFKYAILLKQPLTLSMFVPCDEEGNVLSDPELTLTMSQGDGQLYYSAEDEEFDAYEEAESKVLFKGFEVKKMKDYYLVFLKDKVSPIWASWNDSKKIEDLIRLNLELC